MPTVFGRNLRSTFPACSKNSANRKVCWPRSSKKARPEIQNTSTLRKLIVNLINEENWSAMQADVKGDFYEWLLSKSAAESPKGAGAIVPPLLYGERSLSAFRKTKYRKLPDGCVRGTLQR